MKWCWAFMLAIVAAANLATVSVLGGLFFAVFACSVLGVLLCLLAGTVPSSRPDELDGDVDWEAWERRLDERFGLVAPIPTYAAKQWVDAPVPSSTGLMQILPPGHAGLAARNADSIMPGLTRMLNPLNDMTLEQVRAEIQALNAYLKGRAMSVADWDRWNALIARLNYLENVRVTPVKIHSAAARNGWRIKRFRASPTEIEELGLALGSDLPMRLLGYPVEVVDEGWVQVTTFGDPKSRHMRTRP